MDTSNFRKLSEWITSLPAEDMQLKFYKRFENAVRKDKIRAVRLTDTITITITGKTPGELVSKQYADYVYNQKDPQIHETLRQIRESLRPQTLSYEELLRQSIEDPTAFDQAYERQKAQRKKTTKPQQTLQTPGS